MTIAEPAPASGPRRPGPAPQVVVAGGGGPLGGAVLEALLSRGPVAVLTRRPIAMALPGLQAWPWPDDAAATPPAGLPSVPAALIVFDRERSRRGREDALLRPDPASLPALAQALQGLGVRHLVLVLPHAPALLPQALQLGLATLDEQAVAALGFEHLVLVRPARVEPAGAAAGGLLQRLAAALLSQLHWMVPPREQPLRAAVVAQFVAELVQALPASRAGTRVAPAALLWDWSRPEGGEAMLQAWLHNRPLPPVAGAATRW